MVKKNYEPSIEHRKVWAHKKAGPTINGLETQGMCIISKSSVSTLHCSSSSTSGERIRMLTTFCVSLLQVTSPNWNFNAIEKYLLFVRLLPAPSNSRAFLWQVHKLMSLSTVLFKLACLLNEPKDQAWPVYWTHLKWDTKCTLRTSLLNLSFLIFYTMEWCIC